MQLIVEQDGIKTILIAIGEHAETDAAQFRFRLVFIHREDETLTQEILYTSAPEPLA